jgi:hypothetical protein
MDFEMFNGTRIAIIIIMAIVIPPVMAITLKLFIKKNYLPFAFDKFTKSIFFTYFILYE